MRCRKTYPSLLYATMAADTLITICIGQIMSPDGGGQALVVRWQDAIDRSFGSFGAFQGLSFRVRRLPTSFRIGLGLAGSRMLAPRASATTPNQDTPLMRRQDAGPGH